MVLFIELLKAAQVNLVLKLRDSQILDFDRVSDGPLEANGNGRQVVRVLDQLELGTSMECFALEADRQWFAVQNLEEDAQVVLADLFWVVKDMEIHLLPRSQ